MSLNWSIGVIIGFVSLIPSTFVTTLTIVQYFKDRYVHLKYLAGMWFCLTIWILFQAISDLLLSIPLHLICFYSLILMAYFANLFIDSITRDSVDLVKIILTTIVSSAVVIFSFNSDAVIIKIDAVSHYPTMYGSFRVVAIIQMALLIIVSFYGNLKVFYFTPKNLKFYSFLNLFGTYLWGVQPLWIQFAHLEEKFPGIATGSIALGMCLIVFVFIKHPKLAYILPFKAYRIIIIDTKSGVTLFKHDWSHLETASSENIFSGMMKAISTLFDRTINKGKVREIHFEEAILTFKTSEKVSIACILITSHSSKTLKNSFNEFSNEVFKDYIEKPDDSLIMKTYENGSTLIEEHFPFIPALD